MERQIQLMIYKKNSFKIIIISLLMLLILFISHPAAASTIETKYICIGTDFETPVYIMKTETKKPVIMIIAGTHGNEPAGIVAVNYLKDNQGIKKGTLLMIPNANILACKNEVRSFPKDINLNRVYPGNKQGNSVEKIAYEIFNLMINYDIDFLIDLHESREFYKVNSQNYGQTLVLDCCDDSLLEMCLSVTDELNEEIINPKEEFEVLIKPIEGCATYTASCQLSIPAITFETCKKLPLSKRIKKQLQFTKTVLFKYSLLTEEDID